MDASNLVIERCAVTGLYVGHIPGFVGAHSQGETVDELRRNIEEVVSMLLEAAAPEARVE
jgi:predicted RNase H-like HicB family nuclease